MVIYMICFFMVSGREIQEFLGISELFHANRQCSLQGGPKNPFISRVIPSFIRVITKVETSNHKYHHKFLQGGPLPVINPYKWLKINGYLGYNPYKWSYSRTYNWFFGLPCKIQSPSGPSMYPRPKIHLAKGFVHQRREILYSIILSEFNIKSKAKKHNMKRQNK